MERKVFQSGHMHYADYDPKSGTLLVTFANQNTYVGNDVPQSMWEGLKQSSSPGAFYHNVLKPMIRFEKV